MTRTALALGVVLAGACGERATRADAQPPATKTPTATKATTAAKPAPATAAAPATSATRDTAIFASGCFWCSEADFQKVPGVIDAVSGYTGGQLANPTYEQVSAGGTGHYEAVRVVFDPRRVRYAQLLDAFWRNVDPVDGGGQFCDRGESYRPAIFPRDAEQQRQAAASKQALERARRFAEPIAVAIVPASAFYVAEAYHQEYADRNPLRYKFYRTGCGRDARLREVWGEAAAR